jgi:hypothetical protein
MKILFILTFIFTSSLSFAQDDTKRSTSINFEDEVVEGINRKPLDSFNQLSEQNGRGKNHLYHKRAGFQDRDEILLSEMRLAQ